MKKVHSYTLTLAIDAADQRVVDQFMRESKGLMPSLDAVVYQLVIEGLRAKLESKREENKKKRAEQLADKVTASEGKAQKAVKSSESAQ